LGFNERPSDPEAVSLGLVRSGALSAFHDDHWLMRNGRYDELRQRQRRRERVLGIVLVADIVALSLAAANGWLGDGPLPLDYPEEHYGERWIR
jgi:hypothetical protein